MVEGVVLLFDDLAGFGGDQFDGFLWGTAVRFGTGVGVVFHLIEAGDTDFKKFVHISAGDAEEFEPFEQRNVFTHGLCEHTTVKLEQTFFSVEVAVFGICVVGGVACLHVGVLSVF